MCSFAFTSIQVPWRLANVHWSTLFWTELTLYLVVDVIPAAVSSFPPLVLAWYTIIIFTSWSSCGVGALQCSLHSLISIFHYLEPDACFWYFFCHLSHRKQCSTGCSMYKDRGYVTTFSCPIPLLNFLCIIPLFLLPCLGSEYRSDAVLVVFLLLVVDAKCMFKDVFTVTLSITCNVHPPHVLCDPMCCVSLPVKPVRTIEKSPNHLLCVYTSLTCYRVWRPRVIIYR